MERLERADLCPRHTEAELLLESAVPTTANDHPHHNHASLSSSSHPNPPCRRGSDDVINTIDYPVDNFVVFKRYAK